MLWQIHDGGTGAPTAAGARINLGLGPGSSPTFTNLTLTGNATIGGTLNVTGATTLSSLTVGSITSTNGIFYRNIDTGTMHISGGTDYQNGGAIVLRGGTHATEANDILFYSANTLRYRWDQSALTHIFTGATSVTGTFDVSSTSTFSGVVTLNSRLDIDATTPSYRLIDNDGAADAKVWQVYAPANLFRIQTLSDALVGGNEVFDIVRSGNTITNFQFGANGGTWLNLSSTAATFGNNTLVSGTTTLAQTNVFEGISTDAGATGGPLFSAYRNSASPAASDTIGRFIFNGNNASGTKVIYSSVDGGIITTTAGAEEGKISLRTRSGGANTAVLDITGNVVDLLQGQLKFPATQNASTDANTLDDYEEGTWTPVVEGTTTVGVGTYTTQLGHYVKVGKLVYILCTIVITAHTGTGNMIISGLPFTVANHNAPFTVEPITITLTANNVMTAIGSASTILLRQYALTTSTVTSVALDTAFTLRIGGWYQTSG